MASASKARAPDDGVDLVALDRFLRAGLGGGRLPGGVERDHLDLPARELACADRDRGRALLPSGGRPRQRAGLDREEADPDGPLVRRGGAVETTMAATTATQAAAASTRRRDLRDRTMSDMETISAGG